MAFLLMCAATSSQARGYDLMEGKGFRPCEEMLSLMNARRREHPHGPVCAPDVIRSLRGFHFPDWDEYPVADRKDLFFRHFLAGRVAPSDYDRVFMKPAIPQTQELENGFQSAVDERSRLIVWRHPALVSDRDALVMQIHRPAPNACELTSASWFDSKLQRPEPVEWMTAGILPFMVGNTYYLLDSWDYRGVTVYFRIHEVTKDRPIEGNHSLLCTGLEGPVLAKRRRP